MPKSKSDVHLTPDEVYETIEQLWGYRKHELFDPCPVNPKFDGLKISYKSINYINPPYGQGRIKGEKITLIGKFVNKAIQESYKGNKTIMLLPSKTDQPWFHSLIEHNYEIWWFNHRLRFKNNKDTATQPHFLVMIK